ncbi:MAG: metal-dependent hydrolase [Thermodesulfovibrionales bacterium]|nr:metal-dependent hydrolase [Thermodesulfovibrionales bacterium]
MDPITHALSGAVIHQLGFKRKAALFVIILSAIAPDFDYITRLWGADVFLRYHRGITHGILALALFPAMVAFIFRKKGGFFYYYSISFLAYGIHLLMDLTNQYGTRILSPLDWNQYSLDLTFIIDPYITIGLLLCIIAGKANRKRATIIAICAVILFAGYVFGRSYLQKQTMQFLKTKMDANIYKVYPLPNDFLRWWFIIKSGDEINAGFADMFTKKICVHDKYRLDSDNTAIQESKKDRVVQNFLYFAKYPYAEVKPEGNKTIVTWKELSCSFMAGERFFAQFVSIYESL